MISFIVATDMNRGMGKDNAMPWHLPADFAHFKKNTVGKTVIMGRKTFESIGKVLPERKSIVLTRDENYYVDHPDVTMFYDIEELIERIKDRDEEFMVIGGAEIFKQLKNYVDRVYHTVVLHRFEGLDTHMPFVPGVWQRTSYDFHGKDEKNEYSMIFETHERSK